MNPERLQAFTEAYSDALTSLIHDDDVALSLGDIPALVKAKIEAIRTKPDSFDCISEPFVIATSGIPGTDSLDEKAVRHAFIAWLTAPTVANDSPPVDLVEAVEALNRSTLKGFDWGIAAEQIRSDFPDWDFDLLPGKRAVFYRNAK